MAIWGRITSLVGAGAVGAAARDAVEPELTPLAQTAWKNAPHKVLDPATTAALRARETTDEVDGIEIGKVDLPDDAARGGIGSARGNLLTELARTQPGMGELFALRRRGIGTDDHVGITHAEFRRLLRRQGYTADTITNLENLLQERLDPAQTAAAIHRGLVPDPGLLKGEQPSGPRNVESYPVYPIDPLAEAWSRGYDRDRLGVLVGLQGLPMGVIEAAQAFFRKIITRGDYIAAFNESNNRNEWAEAVLEYAKQIPTARDFFENALRGYHDLAWAQQQAERHGMSPEDSLVIYQNQGRPMNIRQITQALARGAKFHPEPGELTDPYEAATVEGSVKPAYYEMFKALKYTLPSPFVMKSLTVAQTWTEEKAALRLKEAGWIPEDADEAAHAWASGAAVAASPWVTKARNDFWTTTHRSYVAGEMDNAEADDNLKVLGVSAEDRATVLQIWGYTRDTIRKQLTPTQVKKAFAKLVTNPATAKPWTRQDAIDALLARGFSFNDAETFLDTP